jgi:hypothetical protein
MCDCEDRRVLEALADRPLDRSVGVETKERVSAR